MFANRETVTLSVSGYLFLDKVNALPSMEKVAKALDKVIMMMALILSVT